MGRIHKMGTHIWKLYLSIDNKRDLKATAERCRKRRSSCYHQHHGEATTNSRRTSSKTPGSGPPSSQVLPPPCTFLARRVLKRAQTTRTTTTTSPSLRLILNFATASSVIFRSLYCFLISMSCSAGNFVDFGPNCEQIIVFVDTQFVVSLGFFGGFWILDSVRLFLLVFSWIEVVIRFCYPWPISQFNSVYSVELLKLESNNIKCVWVVRDVSMVCWFGIYYEQMMFFCQNSQL